MRGCSVNHCEDHAVVEVILYDLYDHGEVFFKQDFTCPYLCERHLIENEKKARGTREPRGFVEYPYTNRDSAQGFSIYKPLEGAEAPPRDVHTLLDV